MTDRHTGPWNLPALYAAPSYTWGSPHDDYPLVRGMYYEGQPHRGKNTRVAAWFAEPKGDAAEGKIPGQLPGKLPGKLPGVVLVHGGGGKAYPEWAQAWAARGYVAIAMDHAGKDLDGETRLPDGGPDQSQEEKFDAIADGLEAAWPYTAVANTIRAVSFLRSLPQVDPNQIVMTGISWGGYLTCMVSGLDDRLAAAAPVYGCGFLSEASSWQAAGIFDKLPPADRDAWIENFDPSQYLHQCHHPMLWVNGTNDRAYHLGSYQKTYRLPPAERTLSIEVRMSHGHYSGWRPVEPQLFFASKLAGATPLAQVSPMTRKGRDVSITFESQSPVLTASLHYTTDEGAWPERLWHTRPAIVQGNTAHGLLPTDAAPLTYYMTTVDSRGALVSCEHDCI